VGVVEALLLLSENLPRLPTVPNHERHRAEAFMSWNLVGLAVRFGYFIGLDQKTMLPAADVHDEKASHERLAWSYYYIFDRKASIRLGKAFWSRGPGLCFENPPVFNQNIPREAHQNFPSLISGDLPMLGDSHYPKSPADGGRMEISIDDNTILVHAYVELTRILTNTHDTLYLSRDRTIALVRMGEYYHIPDEFALIFTGFPHPGSINTGGAISPSMRPYGLPSIIQGCMRARSRFRHMYNAQLPNLEIYLHMSLQQRN
jgi:hypothetical protein